jgi:hypothetical protein
MTLAQKQRSKKDFSRGLTQMSADKKMKTDNSDSVLSIRVLSAFIRG